LQRQRRWDPFCPGVHPLDGARACYPAVRLGEQLAKGFLAVTGQPPVRVRLQSQTHPRTAYSQSVASLFERLGGDSALMAVVASLYERLLADELTRPFFAPLDIHAQTQKQLAFLSWALDGPVEYRGRDLASAHGKLVEERGLSDIHFERVAFHLAEALRELDVRPEVTTEVLQRVESYRDKVLGRGRR
jgi:hemoglobin